MDGYMPGMDGHNRTLPPPDEHQRHRAALAVCARATDADDARNLLQILGLLPQPETPIPTPKPRDTSHGYGPWLDQYGLVKTCRNGHQWTADNTRWRRNSKTPQCRACEAERDRRRRRNT